MQAQFSSQKDDWETPQELFDQLDRMFHFTLDAASSDENAKCQKHFTVEDDGLSQNWGGVQSFLQSPIWKGDLKMGAGGLPRESETKYPCSDAYSRQNGYILFPRLYLSQSKGNPVYPWAVAF